MTVKWVFWISNSNVPVAFLEEYQKSGKLAEKKKKERERKVVGNL